jgi:hypothetical protein
VLCMTLNAKHQTGSSPNPAAAGWPRSGSRSSSLAVIW